MGQPPSWPNTNLVNVMFAAVGAGATRFRVETVGQMAQAGRPFAPATPHAALDHDASSTDPAYIDRSIDSSCANHAPLADTGRK
jgi:hypothetical protein